MLEHGRSTNRGDLLTDGLEIMVGIILSPKRKEKKSNYDLEIAKVCTPRRGEVCEQAIFLREIRGVRINIGPILSVGEVHL
jgi:hypothetical protein